MTRKQVSYGKCLTLQEKRLCEIFSKWLPFNKVKYIINPQVKYQITFEEKTDQVIAKLSG